MKLTPIIEALRTRCPVFEGGVAGAAQFRLLPESAALPVPCAYVIPLDDNPGDSVSQNSVRQTLQESFAVIVVVANTHDERGQHSTDKIHEIRADLWGALLGWAPDPDYGGIAYNGSQILDIDRARLWWQFEFAAETWLGPEDGWQEKELARLPAFSGAKFGMDCIDPFDSNLAERGPDGRLEAEFEVNIDKVNPDK